MDRDGPATHTVVAEGHDLTIVLAETFEDLDELRCGWTGLLGRSYSKSPFMTWEWLSTWSRQFIRADRRLMVMAFSDGAELVGIAPLYMDYVRRGPLKVREIGFLGVPDAGSDYLDVIAKRGKESVVADAMLAALVGPLASSWDTLTLKEIPAESPFLAQLILKIRKRQRHYSIEEGSFCPSVDLPRDFQSYLKQLTSHGRQAYRRKLRRLLKGNVEHICARGEAVGPALNIFRALYEKRWGQPMNGLFTLVDNYRLQPASAWQVEVSLLHVDAQPIAGLVHLVGHGKVYQYLMAVDRTFNKQLSIGNLMCGLNIQAAIDGGFTEYDFLKGEEFYKLKFMNRARRSLNLRLHNRTPRSLSAWVAASVNGFGKIVLR
jgi:CelD/BcsL family acetyltransferase involved in cellulose biosynthesis